MNPSPGHQKWPDHKVQESPAGQRITVEVGGRVVAESTHALRVDEDHHPVRYYFPRSDVEMECLTRSSTTTDCPFKGTAHYFHLTVGGRTHQDAVWSYEDPYDDHRQLKGLLAFYDDKIPEIHVRLSR